MKEGILYQIILIICVVVLLCMLRLNDIYHKAEIQTLNQQIQTLQSEVKRLERALNHKETELTHLSRFARQGQDLIEEQQKLISQLREQDND